MDLPRVEHPRCQAVHDEDAPPEKKERMILTAVSTADPSTGDPSLQTSRASIVTLTKISVKPAGNDRGTRN